MIKCPKCGSERCVKSGHIHTGAQRYVCKDCGRQFIENPRQKRVSSEKKSLVERLLLERISLEGIMRAAEVGATWLQWHVNKVYAGVKRTFADEPAPCGELVVECDEMWSFVGNKDEKRWIWLATDQTTPGKKGRIVGCFIGDRSAETARKLWESMPAAYQQRADFYTDFWDAYNKALPHERHYPCGKEDGHTAHIERLNGTFRARCSRLVRQSQTPPAEPVA
jgi:IS1 family transposase/DNA-directed RNA polymerase subunit RPC12/RpoP